MHRLVVEGTSTNHNEQLYILRLTKVGRLITYKCKAHLETIIITVYWVADHRSTGHLEHIFTDANSIRYNRMLTIIQWVQTHN